MAQTFVCLKKRTGSIINIVSYSITLAWPSKMSICKGVVILLAFYGCIQKFVNSWAIHMIKFQFVKCGLGESQVNLCTFCGKPPELTWPQLNGEYWGQCPNTMALIDLILCLLASSAKSVRKFSQMKLIKTDQGNRLTTKHLSQVVRISNSAKISLKSHWKHSWCPTSCTP